MTLHKRLKLAVGRALPVGLVVGLGALTKITFSPNQERAGLSALVWVPVGLAALCFGLTFILAFALPPKSGEFLSDRVRWVVWPFLVILAVAILLYHRG